MGEEFKEFKEFKEFRSSGVQEFRVRMRLSQKKQDQDPRIRSFPHLKTVWAGCRNAIRRAPRVPRIARENRDGVME
jgi:hypothetical protein